MNVNRMGHVSNQAALEGHKKKTDIPKKFNLTDIFKRPHNFFKGLSNKSAKVSPKNITASKTNNEGCKKLNVSLNDFFKEKKIKICNDKKELQISVLKEEFPCCIIKDKRVKIYYQDPTSKSKIKFQEYDVETLKKKITNVDLNNFLNSNKSKSKTFTINKNTIDNIFKEQFSGMDPIIDKQDKDKVKFHNKDGKEIAFYKEIALKLGPNVIKNLITFSLEEIASFVFKNPNSFELIADHIVTETNCEALANNKSKEVKELCEKLMKRRFSDNFITDLDDLEDTINEYYFAVQEDKSNKDILLFTYKEDQGDKITIEIPKWYINHNLLYLTNREIRWEYKHFDFAKNYIYTMVSRETLNKEPKKVFNELIGKLNKRSKQQNRLNVKFENEPGIDAGALSRDLISNIFIGMAKTMDFKMCKNGLFRPELKPNTNFKPEDQQVYRDLGKLMMFCLNAGKTEVPPIDYPIGMVFDGNVLAAIQAFPDELLNKDMDVNELFKNPDNLDKLYDVFSKLNAGGQGQGEDLIKMYMKYMKPWDDKTPIRLIETIYDLALDDPDFPDDLRSMDIKNDIAEMRKIEGKILSSLKKVCLAQMLADLGPIQAIARGMKEAKLAKDITWNDVKNMSSPEFSEMLQGKVGKEAIIKHIKVNHPISEDQEKWQGWMEDWIRESDEPTLSRFLQVTTGCNALGQKDIQICDKGNIEFHSCFNQIDFPFSLMINDDKMNDYNKFKELMTKTIWEKETGFNMK